MYPLGHLAIGYLVAKIVGRDHEIDIPLVLVASLVPDMDVIIPNIPHRGPTHSLIVAFILLFPVLNYWKTKIFVYYSAYTSHLFADLLACSQNGRSQLLWPYIDRWIILYPKLIMGSNKEAIVEIALLSIASIILMLTKDYQRLIRYRNTNFLLFFPCAVVLMSFLLGHYYGDTVLPSLFNIPHLLVTVLMLIVIGNNLYQLKTSRYVT